MIATKTSCPTKKWTVQQTDITLRWFEKIHMSLPILIEKREETTKKKAEKAFELSQARDELLGPLDLKKREKAKAICEIQQRILKLKSELQIFTNVIIELNTMIDELQPECTAVNIK